ncbi:unnamed protein product, partial [Scytosiphon promiscuus]
ESDSDEEEEEERKVAMLTKTWTSEARDTYYTSVRVTGGRGGRRSRRGRETDVYRCGDCVMMETDSGMYPAEILHIFKDRHGDDWVEVRWLYTKEEIQDTVPKSRWPEMEEAELLETNDVIANHPGSIAHPVRVYSEGDYLRKERADYELDEQRDFFCRKFYDTRLRRFMPEVQQAPAQRLLRGRRFSTRSSKPDEADSSSSEGESCSDYESDEAAHGNGAQGGVSNGDDAEGNGGGGVSDARDQRHPKR